MNTTASKDGIFVGIMSGTSVDSIDVAAARFGENSLELLATHTHPIPNELRTQIIKLNSPCENELHLSMHMDQLLGELFAEAALELLKQAKLHTKDISAIGSHGQTIRHQIETKPYYTLQIGNPNIIAERTGIKTISDFRSRDMVLGGQGAPFAPAFHQFLFTSKDQNRVIVNIGGMANLTILNKNSSSIQGFDTGPGNVLMDYWINKHLCEPYDHDGQWAKSGTQNSDLLQHLLDDPFFSQPPPKSTGRDKFNQKWLEEKLVTTKESPENIQACLLHLTAHSIAAAIDTWGPAQSDIFVCGGGAHNAFLMETLQKQLKNHSLMTTQEIGLKPNWVEACAFAWLAKQTHEHKPVGLSSVTGAQKNSILGSISEVL